MLSATTTTLVIIWTKWFLALGRWLQQLQQLRKGVLLFFLDNPDPDSLSRHGPFNKNGLPLITGNTNPVQIKTIDHQLQGGKCSGFGLWFEKLGHNAWCLGVAMS